MDDPADKSATSNAPEPRMTSRRARAPFRAMTLERYVPLGLTLVFIVIGLVLVRGHDAWVALSWMNIYYPEDFLHASASSILDFFRNLMIPIPPVVGLGEILSIKLVGSPILVTRYAYRAALVGVYAAAIWLARPSIQRVLMAFLLSLLFFYVTTKVHPGNPQSYDILFPLFFLLFLLALGRAVRTGDRWFWPGLAGFCLSMMELTRPFLIFVLPVALAGAYFMLRRAGLTRQLLPFLLPILVFSGGWHAQLLIAHGQLTLSNDAGFIVEKVWPQVPTVTLLPEPNSTPLGEGRWPNLNTAEHGENSRRLQQAQIRYWLANPLDSALFVFDRLTKFLAGETWFRHFEAESRWFGLYAMVLRLMSSLAILQAGIVVALAVRYPSRIPALLADAGNLTAVFVVLCIIFLAIGDVEEEARQVLSTLPLLATVPIYGAIRVTTASSIVAPSIPVQ